MKKIKFMICFMVLLTMLSGCASNKQQNVEETNEITNTPPITEAATADITEIPVATPSVTIPVTSEDEVAFIISDYYPFKENIHYIYEGEGNEYASYQVFTDYLDGNRIQRRTNNGGSELVQVLEYRDGQLTMLLSKGECYYRENFLDNIEENSEVLIKEPLVVGTEWTVSNNRKRYISNTDIKITTAAGTFHALEITTEPMNTEENGDKTIDYYALKVGLVKTIYISDSGEISSSLSQIEQDASFSQYIRFYYPNVDEDVIYSEDKKLLFKTNDITSEILLSSIKETTQDKYDPVVSSNTKINSLFLNEDNVVQVDFSKELLTEMNAGSGYEELILQCITNILGNYYGVNEVSITVEGKPYESGHIIMKKGETFHLNEEKVVNE